MTGFSRRSLLGYSGSAAAGAVLTSNGTAEAATAVSTETSEGVSTETGAAGAADFPEGTRFN
ncbi:hypothetical protein ACH470_26280 [Streptomyces bottropensis]|uniref:hypothetical protein n=1 Tax=Streptomyces bottropensis TaxID=42235 RepID=UPI0037B14DB3